MEAALDSTTDRDDAAGDLDGDGLSNLEEFTIGTAANQFDTDGDGLIDGLDLNPTRSDNACSGADAVFQNVTVQPGTTVQCGASNSVSVNSSNGSIEIYSLRVSFGSGFTLPGRRDSQGTVNRSHPALMAAPQRLPHVQG